MQGRPWGQKDFMLATGSLEKKNRQRGGAGTLFVSSSAESLLATYVDLIPPWPRLFTPPCLQEPCSAISEGDSPSNNPVFGLRQEYRTGPESVSQCFPLSSDDSFALASTTSHDRNGAGSARSLDDQARGRLFLCPKFVPCLASGSFLIVAGLFA